MKRYIETIMRLIGLERLIFYYVYMKDRKRNKRANLAFASEYPDFPLPPDFLRFDVTATTSAQSYRRSGEQTAKIVADSAKKYLDLSGSVRICEWGCGPGRILYHLRQDLAGSDVTLVGTDMYAPSINWAKKAFGSVIEFRHNRINPPLECDGSVLDMVFAVSVFTHLSEKLSSEWMTEIMRVLKPGGVFLFTSHGGSKQYDKLSMSQRERLQSNDYVSISNWHHGSQMYEGIHPEPYMRALVERCGAKVLSYQPCGLQEYQDIWVAQKQ